MIKALFKHIYKYYKDTFILAIAGVVIGVPSESSMQHSGWA